MTRMDGRLFTIYSMVKAPTPSPPGPHRYCHILKHPRLPPTNLRTHQVKNRMLVDGGPRATGGKTIVDAKKADNKKCC